MCGACSRDLQFVCIGLQRCQGNRFGALSFWQAPDRSNNTLTSLHQCITLIPMRTTVTLDNDVYQAAMHVSRMTGKRLGKVLSELARRGLTHASPTASKGSRRFPVFEVPPNAPIIAATRVQEVIDEEGLF